MCMVMLFRDLLLDEAVERLSSCQLEVDVVAADILNRHEVDGLSFSTCPCFLFPSLIERHWRNYVFDCPCVCVYL